MQAVVAKRQAALDKRRSLHIGFKLLKHMAHAGPMRYTITFLNTQDLLTVDLNGETLARVWRN